MVGNKPVHEGGQCTTGPRCFASLEAPWNGEGSTGGACFRDAHMPTWFVGNSGANFGFFLLPFPTEEFSFDQKNVFGFAPKFAAA